MSKLIIVVLVAVAFLLGGLLAFRRSRGALPSPDVIARVKAREREIEARERAEEKD